MLFVIGLAFTLKTRLVTKRTHAEIVKKLNRELMEWERDKNWPKHFTNEPETYPGAGGYHYAERSRRYNQAKMRKYGHNLPLVLTGYLRSIIKASATITATSSGARLKSHSPHFLRLKNKREIEAVSDRERRGFAERYAARYVELCKSEAYQEKMIRKPVAI